MINVACPTEADTRSVGWRLASLLRVGDVVLLAGELGAGKTVFASGIAEGLGVEDRVTSPSFVLARRYAGLMPLVHADLYRVGSSSEIEDLDLETEAADGVLVVEWGNAAEQAFTEHHLSVDIEAYDDGTRIITLRPSGDWVGRPIDQVAT